MTRRSYILDEIYLRTRLLRRIVFRMWKFFVVSKAKNLIGEIKHESPGSATASVPAIILSSFNSPLDFLILTYLFLHKDLTFIATRTLPKEKLINALRSVNHVLYYDQFKSSYPFFKGVFTVLRDFNRSLVISPEAVRQYMSNIKVDPAVIVKLAMIANVPIIPVSLNWQEKKLAGCHPGLCNIWIGKNIYISPRAEEFKDVFFKRRGARKFRNLPYEDLQEIGNRIFSKIEAVNFNGPGISKEMGKVGI